MSRRKSHEELSVTRARRRCRSMRKYIEEIAYDFADSEMNVLACSAEDMMAALDQFESEMAEEVAHHKEERS